MLSSAAAAPSTPDDALQCALERRLAAYRQGQLSPRQQEALKRDIVMAYQPYVERIARGLARRSYDPVEDLIQVGCMGLIKAMDRYQPQLNVRFKTYCSYHITGEIRHYLRDKASMIKAPRALYELYYRMNQVVQQLTQQLGRSPSDLEVAEALQCPLDQVGQAHEVERRQQVVSLEEFALSDGFGGEGHYVEKLVDERNEESLIQMETRLTVEETLTRLPERLRQVVWLYYFQDKSQVQIADELGISQMQVSRRLKKALGRMEQYLTTTGKVRSPLA